MVLAGPGGPFTQVSATNSYTFTGLGAGTYTVTVTEAGGCIGTATATINNIPNLTGTYTATAATCPGTNNGTLVLNAQGGQNIVVSTGSYAAGSGTALAYNIHVRIVFLG